MTYRKSFYIFVFVVIFFAAMNVYAKEKSGVDGDSNNYICPMHPEIQSAKTGKCSVCGMPLVIKKIQKQVFYICPMHSDVKSEKKGSCPKCEMDLVPSDN